MCVSWFDALRKIQYFSCGIPAKNTEPEYHEKTSDKPRLRNIIQNNWPGPFKSQGQERQRKTEELPGWTKETIPTKCNLWFYIRS